LQTLLQYQDSVYKQNSARELASLQNKFELQRKENIIIQQKLDLSKKNFLFYSSLGLLLVAAAFGLLIFTSYKKRQRLKLQMMLEREKQLSLSAVATAEENERKRIAADLHDNLGVYAASIASNIDHIDAKANAENLHLPLHELRKNSQEIVSQLGDTIWALKKDSLSLTAISDRIKSFIQRIAPSYPQISFDVTENIRNNQLLPPSQAFHLFRIMQEAINNAVKHSHCSHVNVEINGFSNWKILVKDNGLGFDSDKNTGEHNGLSNMKKRCAEFKWQISWQDAHPGTVVSILPTTN
jgi:signal transduction histidine kinase